MTNTSDQSLVHVVMENIDINYIKHRKKHEIGCFYNNVAFENAE